MATIRQLRNAPITEALIDIQVTPQNEMSFDKLSQLLSDNVPGYYVKGALATLGVQVSQEGQHNVATPQSTQIGLRFHSLDEKYVAQLRVNGFTLSRLPPYEDWNNLNNEAKKLWDLYQNLTKPMEIRRIATRFINNLRLPMRLGDSFQDYLIKFVDVPTEYPQAVDGFIQRFQLVDSVNKAWVIVTLALDAIQHSDTLPIIFDIDAFEQKSYKIDDDSIWSRLETLRDLKNRCFFGALTDKTVELYQ